MPRVTIRWAAGLALAVLAGCATGPRGLPAHEGIGNFGNVGDGLRRGAEPDSPGVDALHRLGVRSIIDLRTPTQVRRGEESEAVGWGMVYTNVPLGGWSRPTEARIETVLGLVGSLPPPVFVHCQHGCDRTGTVVACYRIRHDGWDVGRAMAEARMHGMSRWEWGMKRFVVAFAVREQHP